MVDDSSTDDSGATGSQKVDRVLRLEGGPKGPAYGRNRGAEAASGDILLFIDADITVHRDTLSLVEQEFLQDPQLDALFGSYDDQPPAPGTASQFKNLLHHYVHHQGNEKAFTFWAGCGAIRKEAFRKSGGFDESYDTPSIEDIELGYRLRRAGCRIRLRPHILVTHLKAWSLSGMIRTDIFARAVPWTRLILKEGMIPADLNIDKKARLSALLTWLMIFSLVAMLISRYFFIGVIDFFLLVILVNNRLYRFFLRRRGISFMIASVFLHMFYLLYSSAVFTILYIPAWFRQRARRKVRMSELKDPSE